MTTELQRLIDAVRAARATNPLDTEREDAANEALADFVLAHAAAFAERDRLERNVIEANRRYVIECATGTLDTAKLASEAVEQAERALGAWLIAHAASDDPAARS